VASNTITPRLTTGLSGVKHHNPNPYYCGIKRLCRLTVLVYPPIPVAPYIAPHQLELCQNSWSSFTQSPSITWCTHSTPIGPIILQSSNDLILNLHMRLVKDKIHLT